eukprot:4728294-Pleurochrysis_carterae.AAC.1
MSPQMRTGAKSAQQLHVATFGGRYARCIPLWMKLNGVLVITSNKPSNWHVRLNRSRCLIDRAGKSSWVRVQVGLDSSQRPSAFISPDASSCVLNVK